MKLKNKKNYQQNKLKKQLEISSLLFFCYGIGSNAKEQLILNQFLCKLSFLKRNLPGSSSKYIFKQSILKNCISLLHNSSFVVYFVQNIQSFVVKLQEFTSKFSVLSLVVNNKLYILNQLKNICILDYYLKFKNLYYLFKNLLKKIPIVI